MNSHPPQIICLLLVCWTAFLSCAPSATPVKSSGSVASIESSSIDHINVSALHLAVSDGNIELVEQLLSRGVDVDAVTDDLESALLVAAAEGGEGAVALLLDSGGDGKGTMKDGRTSLMLAATAAQIAAENGHVEVAAFLHSR